MLGIILTLGVFGGIALAFFGLAQRDPVSAEDEYEFNYQSRADRPPANPRAAIVRTLWQHSCGRA